MTRQKTFDFEALEHEEKEESPTNLESSVLPELPDDSISEPDPQKVKEYEEKRLARIERLRGRADTHRSQASATFREAKRMADRIPLGQPILVGHHSERRDRNYRGKIGSKYDKAFEQQQYADSLESRADAAERNTSISSDDPAAAKKLREKINSLTASQEAMKAVNRALRKEKLLGTDGVFPDDEVRRLFDRVLPVNASKEELLSELRKAFTHGFEGLKFPSYTLTNNSTRIRQAKSRLKKLVSAAQIESTERDEGVCKVVESVEDNRIRLVFEGKPTSEIRSLLKSSGFRWARSVEAWQRQLNNAGRYAAKGVVKKLKSELDPDPKS